MPASAGNKFLNELDFMNSLSFKLSLTKLLNEPQFRLFSN